MKYLRRLLPVIILILFLLTNGCAPPTSSSGGGGGGGSSNNVVIPPVMPKAEILGKLIVPSGTVLTKNARTMYAALSGKGLPGATVILSSADGIPFDTTISNINGEYLFEDVDPGSNFIIHASLGNINLYGIVPFVNDLNVDVGQVDAASTAVYLMAQYYVDNDSDFTSIADVDIGALETYLENNIALVIDVEQIIATGNTSATSGNILDNVNPAVVANEATDANDTAISITASKNVLAVNEEFLVYVNVGFVTDLYGADFGLVYDSTKIQVKDSDSSNATIQPTYAQGDFFDSAVSNLLVDFENGDYGKLVVGISKYGPGVVGNDGSGNLLRITFKALEATSSTMIYFDSVFIPRIVDSSGSEILTNSWDDICKEISIQ